MNFTKGLNGNTITAPLTKEQINNLKDSRIVSPRVGDNHGIKRPDSFNELESLEEIAKVRSEVTQGITPWWFLEKYYPFKGTLEKTLTLPLLNEGLTSEYPQGLANVVHMDLPSDMPFACHRYLLNEGCDHKKHETNQVNFLINIPYVAENILDGIKRGLDKAFDVKYYYLYARPEERLQSLVNIPSNLLTAYPEGAPNHPTYPAGHGAAAAGGVYRLIKEYQLEDTQLKELLDTAYLWAMFRSFAGVHDAVDNVGGLIVGGLGKYFRKEVKEQYEV